MGYQDLIQKIGKVVEESKLLLRVQGDMIYIEGEYFYESILNKLQRLLQLYRECEWWITKADTVEDGVMYKIHVFSYL